MKREKQCLSLCHLQRTCSFGLRSSKNSFTEEFLHKERAVFFHFQPLQACWTNFNDAVGSTPLNRINGFMFRANSVRNIRFNKKLCAKYGIVLGLNE